MNEDTMKNNTGEVPAPTSETLATQGEAIPADGGAETAPAAEPSPEEVAALRAEVEILRTEHQALHDKHVRLYAEFDNHRKRTAKERLELLQFAGEAVLKAVLPVLDDLERAIANNEKLEDPSAIREGTRLIHQKLLHILAAQGLKPMPDAKGQPFDTDRHEAITKAPAPTPDLKGHVIDVVENGYTLHDKVVRYAKVVVGE
jgi:molecular chaperone GrpE